MSRPSITRIASCFVVAAVAVLAGCSKSADVPQPASAAVNAPAAATSPAFSKATHIHEFKIGELSAVALSDGFLEFPNDNQIFGAHAPEETSALLSAAGLPTDKLHLSVQPLLVKTADRVLLFDTGAAANFGPTAGKLQDSLAAAGVDPGSVTDIFISHLHGDHTGGLVNARGALSFANATIHLSKPEWEFLTTVPADTAKQLGLANRDAIVAAIKPKIDAFAPGAELIPGVVKAVDIKGHTPGHSGYRITSGHDSLIYVGDSMHHYIISVQKPQWLMNFDGDPATGAASRAALIAQLAADGDRIYAVHFPFPGLGKIEKRNDGFVWVAE